MVGVDFGVGLAFCLIALSTALCVGYGIINWNKDGSEKLKHSAEDWAKTEEKIEKDFE